MKLSRRAWPAVALAAAAAGLILFFGLGPGTKTASSPQAADFAYPDLSGKMVSLSSYRGKVVFLDFWATWCDPCREEIPDLVKLHQNFNGKGFTVVGVATDALGKSVVAPFVKEMGMTYPVLMSSGELPEGYPITGFPTGFLIGRDGRVLRRYLGDYPYEELAHDVQEALGR